MSLAVAFGALLRRVFLLIGMQGSALRGDFLLGNDASKTF